MRHVLIALLLLSYSYAPGQTSINLTTLWNNAVRGQNPTRTGATATNANTPVPSGFDIFTDDTNGPPVLTGNTGWPYFRITIRGNVTGQLWRTEFAEHYKDMSLFYRRYSEETSTFSVWHRIHTNQWFNVSESITPTTNGILSYNGTAWTNRTPAILYTNITAATYTLLESDNGKLLTFANACTVTLPLGLSNGFNCLIEQTGTGNVTWALGSGVTQNRYPASATKVAAQYGRATVEHRSGNLFYINGQIN